MTTGRVWKFGDDINTDLRLPGPLLTASEEEQRRAVFSANRPGWVDEVRPGDIIIGGRNFGTGSSRPAARSLRNLGLGALIPISPVPEQLLSLMIGGGIYPLLEKQGLIAPKAAS